MERASQVKKKSLRLQIGAFYTVLALVNITFFSAMILENQTDLLLINFKYQSEDLAKTILENLSDIRLSRQKDKNYQRLQKSLAGYDLRSFTIFSAKDREVWHHYPSQEEKTYSLPKGTSKKISDFQSQEALFRARYLIELDEKDFSLDLLLPIGSITKNSLFLLGRLNVRTVQDRLYAIYYQVAGAVIWGVIFHLLFALFIFRVIFHRVSILKEASEQVEKGDLSARADWQKSKKKGYDELDFLGQSFNTMANSIQEKIETISELNTQIHQELMIGKEVQELFLTPSKLIKVLKPALFYRPLREVSGDIYRYFRFKGGYYGVFFADASGHGVSAALITVITLLSLQEVIVKRVSPMELMTQLNTIMAERLDTSYYATAVFLLFDPKGPVYITNSGHNTVFLWKYSNKEDTAEMERISVKSHGPPLGLMEGIEYPLKKYSICKGDKIFVYSDGLVETENKKREKFGLERILACLESRLEEDNDSLRDKLVAEFEKFAHFYNDDVSFLFIERP